MFSGLKKDVYDVLTQDNQNAKINLDAAKKL